MAGLRRTLPQSFISFEILHFKLAALETFGLSAGCKYNSSECNLPVIFTLYKYLRCERTTRIGETNGAPSTMCARYSRTTERSEHKDYAWKSEEQSGVCVLNDKKLKESPQTSKIFLIIPQHEKRENHVYVRGYDEIDRERR